VLTLKLTSEKGHSMITGLWGRKIGMTQVFTDAGIVVPVTAIDLAGWIVTQIKQKNVDGYDAVQLGCVKQRYKDQSFSSEWLKDKPTYFVAFKEVSIVAHDAGIQVGHPADIDALLAGGDNVDVFGTTIGRGFQGGVKRHGFKGGPRTHGDDLGRSPGSIGYMRSRGRVIKGIRMAGHMGCDRRVMKNLKVIKIEPNAKVVLVKGSIPGKTGSFVFVRKCR